MSNSNISTFHPSSLPTKRVFNANTSDSPQRSPIRVGIDSYSPSIFPSYIHTQKPTVSRPPSNLPSLRLNHCSQVAFQPQCQVQTQVYLVIRLFFPTTLPTSMPSVSTRPSLIPTNRLSGSSPTSLELPQWARVIITIVIVAVIIKYGNRIYCCVQSDCDCTCDVRN